MGCRQPSMLRGSERRQLGDLQEAIRRQLGEYQLDLDLNLELELDLSPAKEKHLADANVDRERREVVSEGRQLLLRTLESLMREAIN